MALTAPEASQNDAILNCPVCLQSFDDKVILNECFHAFCRFCILQWSEFEPAQRHGRNRCPLCRVHFSALFSNYHDQTQSYDIQQVEEVSEPHHWSAFYANKDAIESQKWRSKTSPVVRKRRLLVYYSHLVPIVDFKLPTCGPEASAQALQALTKRFTTKGDSFLSRELPFLLLHDSMDHGLASYKKQERETSILKDVVKSLLPAAIIPLALLIHARVSSPDASEWDLYYSLELTSTQSRALDDLLDAIEQFFGSMALLLLRELALFAMSPYTLGEFDEHVVYQDSSSKQESAAGSPRSTGDD